MSTLLEEVFQEVESACKNPNCNCQKCSSQKRWNYNRGIDIGQAQVDQELNYQIDFNKWARKVNQSPLFRWVLPVATAASNWWHSKNLPSKQLPQPVPIEAPPSPATPPPKPIKNLRQVAEEEKRKKKREQEKLQKLPNTTNTQGKLPDFEMPLLQEVFMEAFGEKELLILEISIPGQEYESEIDYQLSNVNKRIEQCLARAVNSGVIKGIKENTVKRSKDAEIVMELDYLIAPGIKTNQRRGNNYRDMIGKALENCPDFFPKVNVEGKPGVNNRIAAGRGLGPRYVDIRLFNKKGKPIANIEIKRGKSRYHTSQRKKDANIAAQGKGQTYVVRGTPVRKGREV